ncbi:dolichyl-diphosphooligosaccharide--protein glycosyltransferase subunit STT3 [archaeon]|nr:dolichyl-diphosphooligosaccharide--protein glycosyltransferase subunit STT3 [archaeon]
MTEELEIKYNPKKVKEFWKKYHLTIVLLLLIPIFLAGHFRAYPYDLPISNSWAEQTINSNIQSQIQNNILQQYPTIDEQTFNNLVTQQTNLYLKENKAQIDIQKDQIAAQVKSYYQDESGQTYLLAIDPYHYYRQAENFLENGHVGDEIVDGKPLDNHMLAPNGVKVYNTLHPVLIATTHKISQIFGNDSLLKSTFIVPMIISMLAIIPCFFLGRRLGGNIAGTTAAVLLALSPAVLGRTPAGFSDTDAYNVLFPLLIIWLFFESLIAKNKKNKIILAAGAGLSTGIFAYAWYGWWYVFDIILAAMAIYLIFLIIKNKKKTLKENNTKRFILSSLVYIFSSLISIVLMTNISDIYLIVRGPLGSIFIKEAAHSSLWPNVYTTVAELNTASISGIINNLGGSILFALSIVGILLIFFKKKNREIRLKYFLTLAIWFAISLYASTKGMRFILLLVPPFVLGVGLLVSFLFIKLRKWINKDLGINKKFVTTIFIIALIVLTIPWIKDADAIAKNEVPSMNDAWYTSLTKIKQESQEDAIVNSWWDFGHWFKVVTDRAVTFDGATQDKPHAHWMGKVLLTSNKKEAIAILRMLDCGSNDAYDLTLEETKDPLLTKKIIDEIILEDKTKAKEILQKYVENPDKILEKTHCNPPENYFITSQDMVSKAGVWAHFGSWNFERSFAYNEVKSKSKQEAINSLKENLEYSQEEAESTYRQLNGINDIEANEWIAPYPSFGNEGNCQTQNNTVICSNGAKIYLNENIATVTTENGEIQIMAWRDDKQVYTAEEGTQDIVLAYIPSKSKTIFMHPDLLNSMFTELFYYEGKNLDNFELFDHQQGMNGFNIYTWKVKW